MIIDSTVLSKLLSSFCNATNNFFNTPDSSDDKISKKPLQVLRQTTALSIFFPQIRPQ